MKKGLTEIILLLDKSGSMEKIQNDVIGGINTYINSQKDLPGECKFSFYQFDHQQDWQTDKIISYIKDPLNVFYSNTNKPKDVDAVDGFTGLKIKVVSEGVDIKSVDSLNRTNFIPRGGTPLYDALGYIIEKVGKRFASLDESERPEKVLFVIVTDGEENESKVFTSAQVKELILQQTNVYSWEFVYIGANQDAWGVGSSIGVAKTNSAQYSSDPVAVADMFVGLNNSTSTYRSAGVFAFAKRDYSTKQP